MAYHTNVQVFVGGALIATAPRGDVGLPGEHRLTVTNVTWTNPNWKMNLDLLQRDCVVNAVGPENRPMTLNLKISGIKGSDTLHLD